MRRIQVPLDGSKLAEAVLPYAKDLATRLKADLHLVRVVPMARQLAASSFAGAGGMDGMSTLDASAIEEAIQLQVQEAQEYLDKQGAAIRKEGIKVDWEVRQGPSPEEILACAAEHDVDLIAISTHGTSGLRRLVFGSVYDHVVRHAGIPVLVIKPTKDDEHPTKEHRA